MINKNSFLVFLTPLIAYIGQINPHSKVFSG